MTCIIDSWQLLDKKGEGIRILLDAVDFPLGTINNENIGMP
jgi:hypothetical protein